MSEIRFRAWHKPSKRMIYDIQNEFERRIEAGMDCFADYLNNDDFVIEQFTGFKDRHGKKIWEGDIVSSHNGDITGKITQHKCGGWRIEWIGVYGGSSPLNDKNHLYKVIGNIHENPELLEEQ